MKLWYQTPNRYDHLENPVSSPSAHTTSIILHALYHPDTPGFFLIFGESATSLIPRPNLTQTDELSGCHPYAVSQDELATIIPNLKGTPGFITIPLPVSDGVLVCSPEWYTINQIPRPPADTLVPVTIPVLSCPIPDVWSIAWGTILLSGSFNYWMKVLMIAGELVIRGRYKPTIASYQYGGVCTRWEPMLSAYDRSRVRKLESAMPPIQALYLKEKNPANPPERCDAIISVIDQVIQVLIMQSEEKRGFHPYQSLSPIERLTHTPELAALFYLQGKPRHTMPLTDPHISNKWKEAFLAWTDIADNTVPDDLPWSIVACIEEIGGKNPESDNHSEMVQKWGLVFYIDPYRSPKTLIPVSAWKTGQDLPDLPGVHLPDNELLDSTLQQIIQSILIHNQKLSLHLLSCRTPILCIAESELIRFLTNDLPELARKGLKIIPPVWWGAPAESTKIELAVRYQPQDTQIAHVGLGTLLTFDYRIAIGDQYLEREEFRRLVQEQVPYARTKGRWVSLDTGKIQEDVSRLEKKYQKNSLILADFLKLIIQSTDSEGNVLVTASDDWTKNLLGFITGEVTPEIHPIPRSFAGTLRPYQEAGVKFLSTCRLVGFGSCLADDMGLGKTPQTLAYLLSTKEQGLLTGPSLLICPTSILGNWEREIRRFTPSLTYIIHHGHAQARSEQFVTRARTCDLIITSYAIAFRDKVLLNSLSYSTLILDEVQNIKNPRTKQFQAIKTIHVAHRIALTGTPVENNLSELWAIMEILNPGFLGTLSSFQKKYASPITLEKDEKKADELRRMIRPFFLRRLKTDTSVITDLPDKIEIPVYCTFTHEQAALYQATLDNLNQSISSMSGISRKAHILATLTRLKQICNHPDLITNEPVCDPQRSGKVQRLIEMLEEVRDEGEAAIIFTQYAGFAKALATQISSHLNRDVLVLTGATPRLKREELLESFMKQDGPQFFVISLRAGGTGLNLMRATHVFHVDRWWNPAVEDQATDRTYRIGQTKSVQVRQLITSGTLEDQIDEMIVRKRALADSVIMPGEDWLTELPDGELMNVLRLREENFGDDLE